MIKSVSKKVKRSYWLLVLLIVLAYSNTFQVPFIMDDRSNMANNLSIRHLWPLWNPFEVMSKTGIAGRPVVNFTLALNYALSGLSVWSYHLLNLLIHICATLVLFEILQRLFQADRLKETYGRLSAPLALGSALLWGLHPIHTQAVTYLTQRCESLMGLFFFLTCYCAIRGWQSFSPKVWYLGSIVSFLLGIGAKEVIVVAPFILLLGELVFFHPTLKEVIRRSGFLYVGLLCGLGVLGYLVAQGGTFSTSTTRISFSTWQYWLTQSQVIIHYIRLMFWPDALCFDYDWPIAGIRESILPGIVLLIGLTASLWLVLRRHPLGFSAAWFWMTLAPTSLLPLNDPAWDYRMYLPSAALMTMFVLGIYHVCQFIHARFAAKGSDQPPPLKKIFGYVMIFLALLLGMLTYSRNLDYQSDLAIWEDTVRKRPQNARAQVNLGVALMEIGQPLEAIGHLQQGINFKRKELGTLTANEIIVNGYRNLGIIYLYYFWPKEGPAAETNLRRTLEIIPNDAQAHSYLGVVLFFQNQPEKAFDHLQQALILEPNLVEANVNYGLVLRLMGNNKSALDYYQKALHLKPDHIEALYGLGMVRYQLRQLKEAKANFQTILSASPRNKAAVEMLKKIEKELSASGQPTIN
jgi:tetratricopeptide (TPR) repeat protein